MRKGLYLCTILTLGAGLGFACGSGDDSSAAGPADGGSSDGGSGDGSPKGDGGTPQNGFPFTPSNFTLSQSDATATGDWHITGDCRIEAGPTDAQILGDGCPTGTHYFQYALEDGGSLTGFSIHSLTIDAGATLHVTGTVPFVFVVVDHASIAGTLSVSSSSSTGQQGAGAFHGVSPTDFVTGVGPGGASGGAGAGYCGSGGPGHDGDGGAGAGGAPYGTPELVPLVAGSAGSGGAAGGGVLQLVVGGTLDVAASGAITAGGGGGGGGGGSGGSLLLEAVTVSVEGAIAANGGAGGANVGALGAGEDGKASGVAARGGGDGGAGAGSAGDDSNGGAGSAGGGGGASGRIRINTSTGSATISGVLSPSSASGCATTGTVH